MSHSQKRQPFSILLILTCGVVGFCSYHFIIKEGSHQTLRKDKYDHPNEDAPLILCNEGSEISLEINEIVFVNNNDTDNDEIVDLEQIGVVEEVDLQKVTIKATNASQDQQYYRIKATKNAEKIGNRFWLDAEKSILAESTEWSLSAGESATKTLYIEGVLPSETFSDNVELVAEIGSGSKTIKSKKEVTVIQVGIVTIKGKIDER